MLRSVVARSVRPCAARALGRRGFKMPKLELLTMKEMQIARKQRRRGLPYGHNEFMDLLNKMEEHDYDMKHPDIRHAINECERAWAEHVSFSVSPSSRAVSEHDLACLVGREESRPRRLFHPLPPLKVHEAALKGAALGS